MPRSGRLPIVARAGSRRAHRLGVVVATPYFSCCDPTFLAATLRVKKSLPDRGGCSMINNLPKLMGESAARGRFQDENLKLLSVAHGDMECRNILPLGRIAAVIHSRDGGWSQVVHRPLAKSSNTRKLLEFKDEFIHQKQSRAVYRDEWLIPVIFGRFMSEGR